MTVFKPAETDDRRKLRLANEQIEKLERENSALRGLVPGTSPSKPVDSLLAYRANVPNGVISAAHFMLATMDKHQPRVIPSDDDDGFTVISYRPTDSERLAMDAAADCVAAYFRNVEKIERVMFARTESMAPEAKAGPPKAGPNHNGGMV